MTQGFETMKNKIDRFDYLRRNNFCIVNPLHKQNLKVKKKKIQNTGENAIKITSKR